MDHQTTLTGAQQHRAAGVLLAMAAGDALGAGYEFGPPLPDGAVVAMAGGGAFGWEPGEWTDDTAMALVIAQAAVDGDLAAPATLDRIARDWRAWSQVSKDVGSQTSSVLAAGSAGGPPTAESLTRAAERHHQRSGRSGGNGSLMRTAPVALACLHDEDALVVAARAISAMTHHDPEAGDACVLWCLAIRHAVLTGNLDVRAGLEHLPDERRAVWAARLDVAEHSQPADFAHNGWVVEALQAAWCTIATTRRDGAEHVRLALEAAVRGGRDTDTVAAIAGGLLGARHGAAAVPAPWRRILHGWPGLRARDLVSLGLQLAHGGRLGRREWPVVARLDYSLWGDVSALAQHPCDPDVLLGGVGRLYPLPPGVTSVVSLCRLGADDVPAAGVAPQDHVEVWLVDSNDPADNQDLAFVVQDTVAVLREFRAEGHRVLLHCVQARSRTPAIAAGYAMAAFGATADEALAAVTAALPGAHPKRALREALQRLAAPPD